jgi:hypothetical protein
LIVVRLEIGCQAAASPARMPVAEEASHGRVCAFLSVNWRVRDPLAEPDVAVASAYTRRRPW